MDKKGVIKEIFSQRLKGLMEDNNETIYSIAEHVHLSPATISRYTTADMAPKITTIEVLARHFNVNPVWLMGYDVQQRLELKRKEENKFDTIAAHFKGKDISDEKLKRIEKFIEFTLSEEE